MVCKWKQEFLQNAYHAIFKDSEQKAGMEKADRFKRKKEQMLNPSGSSHWRVISDKAVFAKLEERFRFLGL